MSPIRKWTEDEIATLCAMRAAGATYAEISRALGRSRDSCEGKIKYMEEQADRTNYTGNKDPENWIPVSQAQWLERERRLLAEPRDLVGALMGDPPRGYSALEQR